MCRRPGVLDGWDAQPRRDRYSRLTCGFVLMMHLMNH